MDRPELLVVPRLPDWDLEALAARFTLRRLFEAEDRIGGQFLLAHRIPGKEEYAETLRYWSVRLAELGVDVRLGTAAGPGDLAGHDRVVLATGVVPRVPALEGVGHPCVVGYREVLRDGAPVGRRVAVLGRTVRQHAGVQHRRADGARRQQRGRRHEADHHHAFSSEMRLRNGTISSR